MKLPTGAPTPVITQRRDIKIVEVNGEKFEFDVSYGGGYPFDLAVALALLSLDNPKISKIFHEFKIEIKDRNGKMIKF